MKIKYELGHMSLCLTPCPHGERSRVGSNGCGRCPYFVRNDAKRQIIECNKEATDDRP